MNNASIVSTRHCWYTSLQAEKSRFLVLPNLRHFELIHWARESVNVLSGDLKEPTHLSIGVG